MSDAPPTVKNRAPDDDAGDSRVKLMLRAFSHRNYRLFFGGQLVSLIGTFLTQIATPWLVYHLTQDVVLLGVVAFCGQIPMFCLAPFAGVWVDRWNRQRLLVITQTLSMVQSFGLAAIVLLSGPATGSTHHAAEVGAFMALAFCQGLINAFDIPARQAFLVEMVDRREDLANAIALNSTMVHGARFVGPAIGGWLIWRVGPAACFTLDGVSYIGVILALIAMRVQSRPPRQGNSGVLHDLREGMRYIWASVPIRIMLLLLCVLSLTAMPALSTLMPIFAQHFGGGANDDSSARTLGYLMGASGLGAMGGAIFLASRKSVLGLGRLIAMAALLFGVALIAFSCAVFSNFFWLALLIVPVGGVGMLISFASCNTLIQTLTDDHMRGRVMSFFTMAFIGMAPWGSLLVAALARVQGGGVGGAARTCLTCGVIVLIAGALFAKALPAVRKIVRPIYVRKGILPQSVADGLQTAAEVVSGPEH